MYVWPGALLTLGVPSGKIVIDAILPPGNTPHDGKLRDAIMLAPHPGRERTEPGFATLFQNAGLRHVETRAVSASSGLLIAEPTP